MSVLDTYFPFDTGPGANTGMARWRRMGNLWCESGVIYPDEGPHPGEPNPFMVHAWDGNNVVVNHGGCYVGGIYGENSGYKQLAAGSWGLVVVRFDPGPQTLSLHFHPGAYPGWGGTDINGIYEIELAWLTPEGAIQDLRRFVPRRQEGMAEIPAWVARGTRAIWGGPDTQVDAADGSVVLQVFLDSMGQNFEPGRTYRVTGYADPTRHTGTGMTGADLAVFNWDQQQYTHRRTLVYTNQAPTGTHPGGWGSFILLEATNSALQIIATGGNGRYLVNSCRIEVDDLGRR